MLNCHNKQFVTISDYLRSRTSRRVSPTGAVNCSGRPQSAPRYVKLITLRMERQRATVDVVVVVAGNWIVAAIVA